MKKGTTKTFLLVSSVVIILGAVVAFAGTSTYDYTLNWFDAAKNPVSNIHALNYRCMDTDCATLGNLDQEVLSGHSNVVTINYSIPSPGYGYGTYWFAQCYRPMEMPWTPNGAGVLTDNSTFLKYSNCLSNVTDLTANLVLNQLAAINVKISSPTISDLNIAPLAEPASQDIKDSFYSLSTKVDLTIKKGETVVFTDSKTVPIHRDETNSVQFAWTPIETATYTITVSSASVDCKCSNQAAASVKTITKRINTPPVAEANGPYSGNEGSSISFSSAGSNDPDGTIASYLWSFGDGTTSTLANPSHVYADDGMYNVKLTVTDNDGAKTNDTTTATIANVAPTANANGPYTGKEGSAVAFTGSQTDPGTDTFTYLWNFGDGATSTLQNPAHAYADNGIYNITFTVTDDDGGVGSATTAATIANVAPTCDAGAAVNGNEGSSVSFSGTASDVPADVSSLTYSWAFGDGSTGMGKTPSHTYADNGVYTATLTVHDKDGGQCSDTTTATITNVAPTVDVTGPSQAKNNTEVTFTGTFTDPGVLDTFTCVWNFGDSGIPGGGGPGGPGGGNSTSIINVCTSPVTAKHTYAAVENFTVTLTVTDKDNGVGSDTWKIVIIDTELPVAEANGPYSGNEGAAVQFSSAGSHAVEPGTTISSYAWNFGDGTTSTQANPSHVYADNKAYTVTLTVTDSIGKSNSDGTTANIANVAPTCDAGAAKSGNEGAQISFTGTFSDVGIKDTFNCSWNYGDGVQTPFVACISPNTVNHAYADNGTYTATLTVRDKDGGQCSDTMTATIANVAPTVNVGPDRTGKKDKPVQFNATFTDPGIKDIWTCQWNFGDGVTSSGSCTSPATATHTYTGLANFTVQLTVTDKDGGVGSDSLIITIVTTDSPIAEANGPYSGKEGSSISFSSAGSHIVEPGATIVSYFWNFGDGTNSTSATPSHAYADNGVYTAALTVTDNFGKTGSDTANVNVANVAPTCNAGAAKTGNEGASISFSGTFTDPGIKDTFTCSWNYGDGSLTAFAACTSPNTTSHAYADNAVYTVTLTVRDKDGGQCVNTTKATVANVAPVADAGGPYSGVVDLPIAFTGTFTDPGVLDTFTCQWNFGDGTNTSYTDCTSPNAASHAYLNSGAYTVTFNVKDKDGAVGSDTATANVSPFSGTKVFVNPAAKSAIIGDDFTLNIDIKTTATIYADQFDVYFNPTILNISSAVEGNFLKQDGATTFPVIQIDNTVGKITFGSTRFNIQTGVTGQGTLATITFHAKAAGSTILDLENVLLSDPSLQPVNTNVTNGTVNVAVSRGYVLKADINRDLRVNVFDMAAVGLAFGSKSGETKYNADADVNQDGVVNIFDMATVGLNFGKSAYGEPYQAVVTSCSVTATDMAAVGRAYGSRRGDANYNAAADVNSDGVVNDADLAALSEAMSAC